MLPELSHEEILRYSRHLLIPEVGLEGQRKLKNSSALVIGTGGLGSPVALYLAAAGVGNIRVIDDDHVSLSNLQRQVLFGTDDIDALKAETAMHAVARINPDVKLVPINQRLDAHNVTTLLRHSDVIIDGCDNFETRLVVSDAATEMRIPLVSAAIGQFEGQLAVYRGWEDNQPCYRCLVGDDPARAEASCAEQGVLGALPGVIGSLAALEAIRTLVPFGSDSAGKLVIADFLSTRFRTLTLARDPACPCHAVETCPA